jgi:tetratricopeptide (TPR) repeat protein
LQPAIAQLEHAAGLDAEDDDASRLNKLEALLTPTTRNMAEVVPLMAGLLGVPLADRYALPQLTSDLLKRRTLEALAGQMVALAGAKPVFWLIEDAHWSDPTTRELIGLCLDRIRDNRVFVLITFRPELVPAWGNLPHVTSLTLNRLARRQCIELIESLCGGKPLPGEVLNQIVSKTDGIPLFIEELTKTVLESGLLAERDGRYVLQGPLPPMAIPATLQDSLMARLERLSPVKEVAQVGAAIGREFSYGLVAAVAQIGGSELNDALAQLAKAELVFVRGEPPDSTYLFKHALVQDAAYASLLRTRRHHLHARIARALEERYPDVPTRRPELLARHYDSAGLEEPARQYWGRAGRLALANSNYAEADSHFAQALELVAKMPLSEARTREESALLVDRGVALFALRNLALGSQSDVARVVADGVRVSAGLGDHPLHFRARWADWFIHSIIGDLSGDSERADVLLSMAQRIGADDLKLQAHHARWGTGCMRGEVAAARNDIEQGLALYDPQRHRDHWSMYGAHDPGVCARGIGALVLWQAGLAERAGQLAKDAVRTADEFGHRNTRVVASRQASLFAIMVEDVTAADVCGRTIADIADDSTMSWAALTARFIVGLVRARHGDIGRGTEQMEVAFGDLQRVKAPFLPILGSVIASAKLEMGRVEETLDFLDELRQLAAETQQFLFASEFYRLRAEALHRIDPRNERIEEEYRTALQIARRQGAVALELRAATGWASRLAETGRAEEGRWLLGPLYEQLHKDFVTPDLRAAKIVLDRLA